MDEETGEVIPGIIEEVSEYSEEDYPNAQNKNAMVIKVLRENIKMLDIEDEVRIISTDVELFLQREKNKYDVIFADPPYKVNNYKNLKLKIKTLLNPGGVFCMEMKKTILNDDDIRIKSFGNKQIVFWRI